MHFGQSSHPSQRSGVQFIGCSSIPPSISSSSNRNDEMVERTNQLGGRDEDVNTFGPNSNKLLHDDSHSKQSHKQSYVSPFSQRMDSPFSSSAQSPTPSPQFLYSSIQLPHEISSPPVRSMRSYSEQLHTGSNPIYESMPKSSSHNMHSRQLHPHHHHQTHESQESLLSRQAKSATTDMQQMSLYSLCCKECTMHHCEQISMICVNCCEQLCVCCETLHSGEHHKIEKGNSNCLSASQSLVESHLQAMNGEIERLLAMHDGLTSSKSDVIEVMWQHVHETQRFARVIIESVQRNADLLVSKAQEYSNEVNMKLDNAILRTRSDLAELIASFRRIEDAKKAIDSVDFAVDPAGSFPSFSMYLDLARQTNAVTKNQLGFVSGNELLAEFKCEKLFLNETRIVQSVVKEISAKINAAYNSKSSEGKSTNKKNNNSPRMVFDDSGSGAMIPNSFTSPNRRRTGDLGAFGVGVIGSSGVSRSNSNSGGFKKSGIGRSGSAMESRIGGDFDAVAKIENDSHGLSSQGTMLQVRGSELNGRSDENKNPMRAKMRLLDEYLKKKIGGVVADRVVQSNQCLTSTKHKQFRSPGDSRTENENNHFGDATTTTDFSQGFDDSNHFNYHFTNSLNNTNSDTSRLFLTLKHNNQHNNSNNNNNNNLYDSNRSIGKNNGNNNNSIEQLRPQQKQLFVSHDFTQRKKLGSLIAQSPAAGASVSGLVTSQQMNSKVETIKSVDDGYSSRSSSSSSSSGDGGVRSNRRRNNEKKHGFTHSQYKGVLQTRNQFIPHLQQQQQLQGKQYQQQQQRQMHVEQSKEVSEQEGCESLSVRLHKLLEQRRAANLSNQSSRNNSSSSRSTQIALTSRNPQVPKPILSVNPFKEKQRQIKQECQQQQALLGMRVGKNSVSEIIPQASTSIPNAGSALLPTKTFIGNNSLEGFLEYMNRKTTRRNQNFS